MQNLKSLEKKLSFKIILHIGIFLTIGLTYILLFGIIDKNKTDYDDNRQKIIQIYESQINAKDSINKKLEVKQYLLEEKIDSLNKSKNNIYIEYDKKIRNIYSSSVYVHAEWMDSILSKMNSMEK